MNLGIVRVPYLSGCVYTDVHRPVKKMWERLARKDRTKLPVLVVDNEPAVRGFISAFLTRAGFDVMTAECGHEALCLIEANPISVLVTDVHMPSMSGVELALLVTRMRPGTPVMLISGSPRLSQSRSYGWEFLPKPFSCEIFVRSVQRLINQPDKNSIWPSVS